MSENGGLGEQSGKRGLGDCDRRGSNHVGMNKTSELATYAHTLAT
jgi:hypothetical protein